MDKIDPQHLKEINKTIEMASEGYWMPLAVVCLLFSVIIILLVTQWLSFKKNNNERHIESEQQIKLLTQIATELKIDKESKDREFKRINDEVKTNRQDIKEMLK